MNTSIDDVGFDLRVRTRCNDTLEFAISATEPVFGRIIPSKYHGWSVRGPQHVYILHHAEIVIIGLNGVVIDVVWQDTSRNTLVREQEMYALPFHHSFTTKQKKRDQVNWESISHLAYATLLEKQ